MPVKNYAELIVWQKAMDLVDTIYAYTESFPKEELYGLTSQIRKAGISVPSNIAEGQAQTTTKSFIHHLGMAYGSLCELETQAFIAYRRRYLAKQRLEELIGKSSEVGRLINGLLRSLRQKQSLSDH